MLPPCPRGVLGDPSVLSVPVLGWDVLAPSSLLSWDGMSWYLPPCCPGIGCPGTFLPAVLGWDALEPSSLLSW